MVFSHFAMSDLNIQQCNFAYLFFFDLSIGRFSVTRLPPFSMDHAMVTTLLSIK